MIIGNVQQFICEIDLLQLSFPNNLVHLFLYKKVAEIGAHQMKGIFKFTLTLWFLIII